MTRRTPPNWPKQRRAVTPAESAPDDGDRGSHRSPRSGDGATVYDEARADSARDFVEDLMAKMGMEVMVDLVEPEPGDPPGEIRIEIEGRDSGRIIGKKGQVLSAIQHIVNRVVNRPGSTAVTWWSTPRATASAAKTRSPPWRSGSARRRSKKARSSPSSR